MSERIEFVGGQNDLLAGRLERAEGSERASALFAHCFTCSKDAHAASRVSRALAARGITVLRFDFTGLGNSAGDFENTTFSSNVQDLVAAAAWLRDNVRAPELLVGHSLGGAAVLRAAARVPGVRAVATIGSPFDPAEVRHLLGDDEAEIVRTGRARVRIGGRSFSLTREFLEDLEKHRSEMDLRTLKCAKLLFHSPVDDVVHIEQAESLYDVLTHPKSLITLDGADHLLTRKEDSSYVASVLATWVERYLSLPQTAAPSERNEGRVVVEGHAGSFRTHVAAGNHVFLADEPTNVGGSDMGPSPYDLLLASLGACTSMTLHMYARRKKWPLESVRVVLEHEKVHEKDGEESPKGGGKLQQLTRTIVVEGLLSPEQAERLLQIANKCPVHNTLVGPLEIPTTLRRRDES